MTSGLAIYDTIQFLTCDVNTYCIGQAASMGAVLLCGGTKGKRYALPNANVMIHQVLGGAEGPASDVEIRVKYMLRLKQRLNSIVAHHTGKSIEQVEKDTDRDYYMTPDEAKAYGNQAKEKATELAVEGKARASEAILTLGKMVEENVETIDARLGPKYGDYARKASTSIQDAAARLDAKDLGEIGEEARAFVRKSPGLAIGLAAVAGYMLARAFRGSSDGASD